MRMRMRFALCCHAKTFNICGLARNAPFIYTQAPLNARMHTRCLASHLLCCVSVFLAILFRWFFCMLFVYLRMHTFVCAVVRVLLVVTHINILVGITSTHVWTAYYLFRCSISLPFLSRSHAYRIWAFSSNFALFGATWKYIQKSRKRTNRSDSSGLKNASIKIPKDTELK